jgi:hypothetical protein
MAMRKEAAKNVLATMKKIHGAHYCKPGSTEVLLRKKLINKQKNFCPAFNLTYQRSTTISIFGWRDTFAKGRSCIDILKATGSNFRSLEIIETDERSRAENSSLPDQSVNFSSTPFVLITDPISTLANEVSSLSSGPSAL